MKVGLDRERSVIAREIVTLARTQSTSCNRVPQPRSRMTSQARKRPTARPTGLATRRPRTELGVLLLERGDLAGAETAFRRSDERGSGEAASNLSVILDQIGDRAGAEAARRRAAERGFRPE
jgi:Flp pilus assembly protein TadD